MFGAAITVRYLRDQGLLKTSPARTPAAAAPCGTPSTAIRHLQPQSLQGNAHSRQLSSSAPCLLMYRCKDHCVLAQGLQSTGRGSTCSKSQTMLPEAELSEWHFFRSLMQHAEHAPLLFHHLRPFHCCSVALHIKMLEVTVLAV